MRRLRHAHLHARPRLPRVRLELAFSLSCVCLGRVYLCLEILELFSLRAVQLLHRGHRGGLVASEQMYAVNWCPSTPETLGDNEEDFSQVRFCAASRISASVASPLKAPRRVMIVSCAPVMEEVRVHQRRKLKRTHPLPESINLFYVQNTMTSAVHHRLE